jgi:hypothetical protein
LGEIFLALCGQAEHVLDATIESLAADASPGAGGGA